MKLLLHGKDRIVIVARLILYIRIKTGKRGFRIMFEQHFLGFYKRAITLALE